MVIIPMKSEIRHGRHCVFMMHVHLVFVAKYRRTCFSKQHIQALQHIFNKVCLDFDAELIECEGEKDHIHLLINYPPKVSISKLVNSLKGVSSRRIRQQFEDIHQTCRADQRMQGMIWQPALLQKRDAFR